MKVVALRLQHYVESFYQLNEPLQSVYKQFP